MFRKVLTGHNREMVLVQLNKYQIVWSLHMRAEGAKVKMAAPEPIAFPTILH